MKNEYLNVFHFLDMIFDDQFIYFLLLRLLDVNYNQFLAVSATKI